MRIWKIVIVLSILAWLTFPILCHLTYNESNNYLSKKYLEVTSVLKDTDTEVWALVKGLPAFSNRIRDKYLIPFTLAWLLTGIGLFYSIRVILSKPSN